MFTPLGPRERRGPRLIVRELRWRTACEEEFHHLHRIGARSPRKRRRPVLVVPCRDIGPGVEDECCSVDSSTTAVRPIARVVEERLMLPVHLVRAHPEAGSKRPRLEEKQPVKVRGNGIDDDADGEIGEEA